MLRTTNVTLKCHWKLFKNSSTTNCKRIYNFKHNIESYVNGILGITRVLGGVSPSNLTRRLWVSDSRLFFVFRFLRFKIEKKLFFVLVGHSRVFSREVCLCYISCLRLTDSYISKRLGTKTQRKGIYCNNGSLTSFVRWYVLDKRTTKTTLRSNLYGDINIRYTNCGYTKNLCFFGMINDCLPTQSYYWRDKSIGILLM